MIKVKKNDSSKRTETKRLFQIVMILRSDHLIADELSAELAEGVAYVAGHDDESRPVMVIFSRLII